MKKITSWLTSMFLVALFCTSSIVANACTQSFKPCKNYPGYWLYCKGPTTSSRCWSGGCGGPVGPVYCQDDPQQ